MELTSPYPNSIKPVRFGVYKGFKHNAEWFFLFDEKGWHSEWERFADAVSSSWYPIDEPVTWWGLSRNPE